MPDRPMPERLASGGCTVVIFAKAPVAGRVKTRLAGALGAAGAATLAARMLEAAVSQAVEARLGPVELCCAPEPDHPAFEALARRFPIVLTRQGDGDLGQRMAHAFERVLLGSTGQVLLIGTDAPGVDAAYLQEAARALSRCDVVIGPALDGGYTLIGLQRPAPGLFEGVDWSTPQVLAQTRARLARSGLTWIELDARADIDTPDDLVHLPASWRTDGHDD